MAMVGFLIISSGSPWFSKVLDPFSLIGFSIVGYVTSFVEHLNWTVITTIRCCTRLSNGFSRKLENHAASPQLFRLQLDQNSSYTSQVGGNGSWRDRSTLGSIGLDGPPGRLRTAEGGKSSIGELACHSRSSDVGRSELVLDFPFQGFYETDEQDALV